VQTRRERLFVRAASLGVVGGSVVLAGLMQTPSRLPGAALGSGLLLFFERLAIVLVALLFVLVAAYRGWRGELPQRFSDRGAEWEPVAFEVDALQGQIDSVRARIALIEENARELGATMRMSHGAD
jgi:hypothetical protein